MPQNDSMGAVCLEQLQNFEKDVRDRLKEIIETYLAGSQLVHIGLWIDECLEEIKRDQKAIESKYEYFLQVHKQLQLHFTKFAQDVEYATVISKLAELQSKVFATPKPLQALAVSPKTPESPLTPEPPLTPEVIADEALAKAHRLTRYWQISEEEQESCDGLKYEQLRSLFFEYEFNRSRVNCFRRYSKNTDALRQLISQPRRGNATSSQAKMGVLTKEDLAVLASIFICRLQSSSSSASRNPSDKCYAQWLFGQIAKLPGKSELVDVLAGQLDEARGSATILERYGQMFCDRAKMLFKDENDRSKLGLN